MEVKEFIGKRRTIRFYLPYRPVERDKIEKMLEAARRASCVGNVNNTGAVVIWRDQAGPEVLRRITPGLGYQQMQTAPCFILWYNDTSAYQIDHWISTLLGLADQRRIGTNAAETRKQIESNIRPLFAATWQQAAVAPLAYMDVGQAIAQATMVAYDEGLGTCCMSSPRIDLLKPLLGLPDTAIPVCLMSVGYPAESFEAGGQTQKAPFGQLFSEMKYGEPFKQNPAVEAELKRDKMIQEPAPLPWRDEELAYVMRALGLEDRPAGSGLRPPAPGS